MKNQFKVNDIVKIVDINLLDCYNPETDEKDLFWGDKFEVLEVIEYDEEDCDLLVKSLRFGSKSLINAQRFILV